MFDYDEVAAEMHISLVRYEQEMGILVSGYDPISHEMHVVEQFNMVIG